jgi:putative SOS response-associated peptidase YedK
VRQSEIRLVFSIPPERPTPNFEPSWNGAPTDQLPIVRFHTRTGQRSLDLARWGLVPFWSKDINVGFANINHRGGAARTQLTEDGNIEISWRDLR